MGKKKKDADKVALNVMIDPLIKTKLKEAGKEQRRSMNNMLECILEEYFDIK